MPNPAAPGSPAALTALTALTALSPLDGRYRKKVMALAEQFSEYGLIRNRIRIEIRWLKALEDEPRIAEVPPFSEDACALLGAAAADFGGADAERVKAIERTTNHDVKAIEYWLREVFATTPEIARAAEFIHFACTSEDINNVAYGLMLSEARRTVLLPAINVLIDELRALAHAHAALPMLGRTHGQPATPTTLGKEIANVVARLEHLLPAFAKIVIKGKMNGAVGNYNAHVVAYPGVACDRFAARVVMSLGPEFTPH